MAFGSRRSSERTAEDRARAAAERAARRAKPPPPPEAFLDTVPPPDVESAGESPAEPEPPAAAEPPAWTEPPAEPEPPSHAEPDAAPQPESPVWGEAPSTSEPQPSPEPQAPAWPEPRAAPDLEPPAWVEPQPTPTPDPQRTQAFVPPDIEPQATRAYEAAPEEARDARPATAVQDRPPPPRRLPAARGRRRPAPRRLPTAPTGSRSGSWLRRIGAVVALLAIGTALYAINATFQPFHGEGTGSVRVSIPDGADASRIGDILAEAGVVDSGTFFQLNATLTGRRGGLRSGDYTLRRGMSNGDAIAALEQGPRVRVVPTVDITIPEGPSIRETAASVDLGALNGRYVRAASSRSVLRRIRDLGAPRGTDTAEGFLFPATYTLKNGGPMSDLVSRQLDAFEENFGSVDLSFAKRRNLTRYDVLIIASLVERETQVAKERPLVASVIYNRLRIGMPLGIDATIRYHTRNWTRPIRQSELEDDNPYNTRLRQGLPPTPIGNPGLASIEAAARPARTDYLFFVRIPGDEGRHAFSETDAQFQRDVQRYQESRGGP
jgi:UPF0755 protein